MSAHAQRPMGSTLADLAREEAERVEAEANETPDA
jgi:hypothetical protein